MVYSSVRRTDLPTPYDFFWVVDEIGRIGLKICFDELPLDFHPLDRTGAIIQAVNRAENQKNELFLLIADPADQGIFYRLCIDLIAVSQTVRNESELCRAIEKRLRHWQRFLNHGASKSMPEHLQMGLYAELSFLKEALSGMTPADALAAWVGPDFDKQDFSFESCLAEVKCFLTSKGPFITISSMHQLYFDVKPLYLAAFGVSRLNSGLSVSDLAAEIRSYLTNETELDTLESKLNSYGYFEGITEGPFYSYHTDSRRRYYIETAFPRIIASQLAEGIQSVQYSIDLSKCAAFEVDTIPFHRI